METPRHTPQRIVLDARDVTAEFDGAQRLHHISFQLFERHIMCVIGENGSGKSLLLKVLAGDRAISSGRLIRNADATVFRVAPDQLRANGLLAAGEFLTAATTTDAVSQQMALESYELNPDQLVRTLSSGERLRLLFACAELVQATVTLFDVPIGELDSDGFDRAESLVRSLADSNGAVIVATTSPELVLRLDNCALYRMRSGHLELVRERPADST